ncbi:MAG: rRNA maturation RNase YbeY [Nitrospinales bacterium]
MPVLLRNAQKRFKVDVGTLKKQIQTLLAVLNCSDSELSILLVNDRDIQELNCRYRNIDRATDVLSFPQQEGELPKLDTHLLGDIVVSVETAHSQAEEHQLSFEEELILLIIHGLLHLLDYDHERSHKEEERMKKKTLELFSKIFPEKNSTGLSDY